MVRLSEWPSYPGYYLSGVFCLDWVVKSKGDKNPYDQANV